MSPAIKRMQHTHGLFFVCGGTSLHNRAYQHLQKSASHSVNNDRNQDSGKWVSHPLWQYRQADQAQG